MKKPVAIVAAGGVSVAIIAGLLLLSGGTQSEPTQTPTSRPTLTAAERRLYVRANDAGYHAGYAAGKRDTDAQAERIDADHGDPVCPCAPNGGCAHPGLCHCDARTRQRKYNPPATLGDGLTISGSPPSGTFTARSEPDAGPHGVACKCGRLRLPNAKRDAPTAH